MKAVTAVAGRVRAAGARAARRVRLRGRSKSDSEALDVGVRRFHVYPTDPLLDVGWTSLAEREAARREKAAKVARQWITEYRRRVEAEVELTVSRMGGARTRVAVERARQMVQSRAEPLSILDPRGGRPSTAKSRASTGVPEVAVQSELSQAELRTVEQQVRRRNMVMGTLSRLKRRLTCIDIGSVVRLRPANMLMDVLNDFYLPDRIEPNGKLSKMEAADIQRASKRDWERYYRPGKILERDALRCDPGLWSGSMCDAGVGGTLL